jgi:hypothetical protein
VVQQCTFITHFFRDPEDVGRRAHQFLRLYTIFKEMLISGTLRGAKNWLPKARVWRTILLANDEGFWEPSEQLAFALQANNQASPFTKLQGLQVVTSLFSTLGSMFVGTFITGESSGTGDQVAAGATLVRNVRALVQQRGNAKKGGDTAKQQRLTQEERSAAAWDDGDDTFTLEDGVEEEVREGNADPLSFSADAILETVPAALTAALGGDAALVGRVWATSLVAALLESNEASWRVSPRSTPLAEQQTLLDIAQAWVSAAVAAVPDDALLVDVARAARLQIRRWAKLHDRRVTCSRGAHIATHEHAKLQLRNAASTVHSTLVNGHPVISLFTSELSIGFARWMGMNVIVSALMAMLVVNIWFCAHPPLLVAAASSAASPPRLCTALTPSLLSLSRAVYSKGAVCCEAALALLGCAGGDPTLAPCLDFMGSCADLLTQPQVMDAFTRLPDGPFVADGAFVCTAFPADDSARDTVLSGLISFAVSVPVAIVIANCFGLSTATDDDQLHGRTRWLKWPAKYRFTLGQLRWRWAGATARVSRKERLKRFLASWWCSSIYVDGLVWLSDKLQPCFCRPPRAPSSALAPEEDAAYDAAVNAALRAWGQDEENEKHFGTVTNNFKRAGYVILHLCWGVFAWITFAYGRLVYNLLGARAARDFSNSWGIGVAVSQANDASSLVTAALQAALIVTILEALWLMTNVNWLESYIDFVSVHATVVASQGGRGSKLLAVLAAHKRHSYAVA